ncbi:hypothetical protein Btru_042507 [Bulinus truncatus]|nr:hypothetical protein Btru_042507 [Bulinus truncatus]
MPKHNVDNAFNRSLGRVGMEHGTAVFSRDTGICNFSASSGDSSGFFSSSDNNSIAESLFSSSNSSSSSRSYVDNSFNRSLGRVGLPHGTAVHSRSSGMSSRASDDDSFMSLFFGQSSRHEPPERAEESQGSRYMSAYASNTHEPPEESERSQSGSKRYVDNSFNRSLGRVGLEHGSAVHSKSEDSSSGSKKYVDNSLNQSLGRVGLEHGTAIHHKSENKSSDSKCYVDNSLNRSLGRVGLEHGTAVHHKSEDSSSGSKTYVDNAMNRSLGRVGKEHGSAVNYRKDKSSGSDATITSQIAALALNEQRVYKDNSLNRKLGRVGKQLGSERYNPHPRAHSFYVDNDYNRRYDRVGKPLGSVPIPVHEKRYRDNPLNRELGRVGLPWGACKGKQRNELLIKLMGLNFDNELPDELVTQYEQADAAKEFIDQYLAIVNREKHIQKMLEAGEQMEWNAHEHTSKNLAHKYKGNIIKCQELIFRHEIGHGSFGKVFLAEWSEGEIVAVKVLKEKSLSKRKQAEFEKEIILYCSLEHDNIVMFLGACNELPHLAIVMEYMELSLHEAIHIKQVDFSEEDRIYIMKDIVQGLDYLHNNDIAHCDLKPGNVLLNNIPGADTADSQMRVIAKLTDFGLSLLKSESDPTASNIKTVKNIGTPRYSAPEVLRGESLTVVQMMKADIYSIGLVVLELLLDGSPFEGLNLLQLRKEVGVRGSKPIMENGSILKESIKHFTDSCFSFEPKLRPSIDSCRSYVQKQKEVYKKD